MHCKIRLSIELSGEQIEFSDDVELPLAADRPGISLESSKTLLKHLQRAVVNAQSKEYVARNRDCPDCSTPRRIKGYRSFQYRTLFGIVVVDTPRLHEYDCSERSGTFSMLNGWCPDRVASDLLGVASENGKIVH